MADTLQTMYSTPSPTVWALAKAGTNLPKSVIASLQNTVVTTNVYYTLPTTTGSYVAGRPFACRLTMAPVLVSDRRSNFDPSSQFKVQGVHAQVFRTGTLGVEQLRDGIPYDVGLPHSEYLQEGRSYKRLIHSQDQQDDTYRTGHLFTGWTRLDIDSVYTMNTPISIGVPPTDVYPVNINSITILLSQ